MRLISTGPTCLGIERGVRNVSVLTVAKIAKALKVSLTTLFDRL